MVCAGSVRAAESLPVGAPPTAAVAVDGLVFEQTVVRHVAEPGREKIEASFPFVNRSANPVVIFRARATCGCTVPSLPKERYAAGEAGEILVTFVPGSRQGLQSLPVTVSTDHGDHALQLLVDIPPRIELVPKLLHFRGGEPGPKIARLRFLADTPVVLEALPLAAPGFGASLRPIVPGVEFEVVLTYAGAAGDARTAHLDLKSRGVSGREAVDRLYLRHAP